MGNTHRKALESALEWYVDNGIDQILGTEPIDRTQPRPKTDAQALPSKIPGKSKVAMREQLSQASPVMMGRSDARLEAEKLAAAATTLEGLRAAIAEFDGLSIKKTATNLVFSDGNPKAEIMLVGEAPGADEDRQAKPFVGDNGALLDEILACINLSRSAEKLENSVYISNILNWRPPGNRTPNDAEIDVSLPFIEKHIMLVKPKILILCGGIAAKSLLDKSESISRLRKTWHDYTPQTTSLGYEGAPISAIATYHPAYLLRTPAQKRAVWADMLSIQEKRNDPPRK